jgi:Ca2+-binding EF-hand superfamily protein
VLPLFRLLYPDGDGEWVPPELLPTVLRAIGQNRPEEDIQNIMKGAMPLRGFLRCTL